MVEFTARTAVAIGGGGKVINSRLPDGPTETKPENQAAISCPKETIVDKLGTLDPSVWLEHGRLRLAYLSGDLPASRR